MEYPIVKNLKDVRHLDCFDFWHQAKFDGRWLRKYEVKFFDAFPYSEDHKKVRESLMKRGVSI